MKRGKDGENVEFMKTKSVVFDDTIVRSKSKKQTRLTID